MNRLITYSLIAGASAIATAAFANAVGDFVVELFQRTLQSFPV